MVSKKIRHRIAWIAGASLAGLGLLAAVFLAVLLFAPQWMLAAQPIPTPAPIVITVTATLAPSETALATTVTIAPSPSPVPPSETPPPSLTPTPGAIRYTVQSGDTLSGIAFRFGVSVELLQQINNLTSDLIYPDQTLLIPAPSETLQPLATDDSAYHRVLAGETIQAIAASYGVSLDDLRAANFMAGDALLPGQQLMIPEGPVEPAAYRFSPLVGDLALQYPLVFNADRFALHFKPDSFTAVDPEAVALLIDSGLTHIEAVFQASLEGAFDVYAAGSVFEPTNRHLRGRSFSSARYYFFVHDGTGNAEDQLYLATHELTHLFTWNVFGAPVSAMLSEGAAVYVGMNKIETANPGGLQHIPLNVFCAAYEQAGALPRVSGSLAFEGHNYDLPNYYAAGCFAGYLITTYGPASFGLLYPSGDFPEIYGKSLSDLETDWRAALKGIPIPAELDPPRLIAAVETVTTAYRKFFPYFIGTPAQVAAYRELDRARLSLLEMQFDRMEEHLTLYRTLLP